MPNERKHDYLRLPGMHIADISEIALIDAIAWHAKIQDPILRTEALF